MDHQGLNQLVCAALINNGFREMLLRDPSQALSTGYHGFSFSLTPEERAMVVGIRVEKLEDFASHVHAWIVGNGGAGQGRVSRGNGHHRPARTVSEPFAELYRAPVPA